jgi:hypothetical protein
MNQIYRRREFIIFKVNSGFILYNTKKTFEEGHTHLTKYTAAISIIKLIERKEIPRNKNIYFLKSILRVNNDCEYEKIIRELINDQLPIDFTDLMQGHHVYKRRGGAMIQVK